MSYKVLVYCVNFRTKKIAGGGDLISEFPFLFTNKKNGGWNALVKFDKLVGWTVEGKKSISISLDEVMIDCRNRIIPEIQLKGNIKLEDPENVIYDLDGIIARLVGLGFIDGERASQAKANLRIII